MADYFPLLARALDTMSDRDPDMRHVVYDRARTALLSQLRALDPPLGEAEIERERVALDDAIARAERVYGGDSAPRPAPAAAPEPELPADPEWTAPARQPTIRRGSQRKRSLTLAIGLVTIMVPVAILGWIWRERPAPEPQPTLRTEPTAPSVPADAKFADRIGGAPARPAPTQPSPPPAAPVPGLSTAPAESPPAPLRAEPPALPPQPELAVAQRALLIEENTADPQQPKVTAGRTLWRIDALNAGQGQPLETIVRVTVALPEAGLSLMAVIRRNTDTAFPASHTIELTFTPATPGDPSRTIRDVALPQLKTDEAVRGVPLAGLSVPVKENIFLIGLSDLRGDIERNSELLLRRNWIDLPVRSASGGRAVVSFEKGVSGDRVLTEAFRQWNPTP